MSKKKNNTDDLADKNYDLAFAVQDSQNDTLMQRIGELERTIISQALRIVELESNIKGAKVIKEYRDIYRSYGKDFDAEMNILNEG
jgi:hypothetical protein